MLPAGVVRGALPSPAGRPGQASLSGRLLEVSGTEAHAPWGYAAALVVWAQGEGETCAWVQACDAELYPPDLAAAGVDLDRLLVVRVPPAAGAFGLPRAAEVLLGSRAVGLVVVDCLAAPPPARGSWQSRLLGLARAAGSTVVVLTHKQAGAPSLGALCSWRIEPQRRLTAAGQVVLEERWLRDKAQASWPPLVRVGLLPWLAGAGGGEAEGARLSVASRLR